MTNGNVEIKLPKEEQVLICCSKVGSMENGEFVLESSYLESGVNLNVLRSAMQLERAAKRLSEYSDSGVLLETDSEGIARMEDMEEGVYLINSLENQTRETILPTLFFLPTWDEAEETMLYDITIIPKFGEKSSIPDTGDGTKSAMWIGIFMVSTALFLYQMKKMKKRGLFFK